MSVPVAVRLPEALAARLETLATTTRRPKSVYILEALENELDRIEWEQGILSRREEIRSGRVKAIPSDVVRQRLGLDS